MQKLKRKEIYENHIDDLRLILGVVAVVVIRLFIVVEAVL